MFKILLILVAIYIFVQYFRKSFRIITRTEGKYKTDPESFADWKRFYDRSTYVDEKDISDRARVIEDDKPR